MKIPECVKIESAATQSNAALVNDGWREIGTLIDFSGDVDLLGDPHMVDKIIHGPERLAYASDLATSIQWSGRLFRDPLIPPGAGMKAILMDLREAENNGTLFCGSEGFIITRITGGAVGIQLIGVRPESRGCGYAAAMIRNAIRARLVMRKATVLAGTYSDNAASCALYGTLGMKPFRERIVYHK